MKFNLTYLISGIIITAILSINACTKSDFHPSEGENAEIMAGGKQTIFDASAGAFSGAFPDMTASEAELHRVGDIAFEASFVSAPAPIRPGLGAIFNNVACTSCHVSDGRGKPPASPDEQLTSMLIRLSVPGEDEHGGPKPVPGFGGQLQTRAIYGYKPEADVEVAYTDKTYHFADGATYALRTPRYVIKDPYAPLPGDLMISPRIAAPALGLGLLEAVPESEILAHADPVDKNGDGISGKANYVWDIKDGKTELGRFGWKANQPTLLQQSASAYNEDMGITNFIYPRENAFGQPQYQKSGGVEVSDSLLYATTFYVKTLAVPARRNINDPNVKRGQQIFMEAKCATCHMPTLRTGVDVAFPQISNQQIHPYTDLLLHDMGEGLADGRPDYKASGSEWRTAPLWGIGLTKLVNGHTNFLHDGRARSLMEAIMWHGGEAAQSREFVRQLAEADRDALLAFLNSL